jgi:ribosomal protein L40E
VATQVVSAIQQHSFDDDGGDLLSFTVFGTTVSFAEILLYAITLVFVALALFATWWVTRRASRVCPECRSTVPASASICRFCTTELLGPWADA